MASFLTQPHSHALPPGCHLGHTQTTRNKELASALPGLQVMSGPTLSYTHKHISTLILDLYGVLHPPLNTAVKAFLNSYKRTIFKELHTQTHSEEPYRLLSGLNHFTLSFKETV